MRGKDCPFFIGFHEGSVDARWQCRARGQGHDRRLRTQWKSTSRVLIKGVFETAYVQILNGV
jgi:hypothetical protein